MKSRLLETACFMLFFASCHHKSLGLGELAPKSNIKLYWYLLLRFVIETSLPRDLKNLAGPWFLLVNSSSGDIDKPVILVAGEFDTRILIGNGTGKYRKISDVSACKLSQKQRKHKKALLGLRSFTGNDYVSSILRRGKQLCWKHVKEYSAVLD